MAVRTSASADVEEISCIVPALNNLPRVCFRPALHLRPMTASLPFAISALTATTPGTGRPAGIRRSSMVGGWLNRPSPKSRDKSAVRGSPSPECEVPVLISFPPGQEGSSACALRFMFMRTTVSAFFDRSGRNPRLGG